MTRMPGPCARRGGPQAAQQVPSGGKVVPAMQRQTGKEYTVTVNLPPIEGYDWADMAKEEKEKRAARSRAVCLDREL